MLFVFAMSRKSFSGLLNRAFNVSVVPFAAVAGRLAEPDAAAAKPLTGQAFCFLPITTTDLPVHVNGNLLASHCLCALCL